MLSTRFFRQHIPVPFLLAWLAAKPTVGCARENSSLSFPFTFIARICFLALPSSASLLPATQNSSHHLNLELFSHALPVFDFFVPTTSLTWRLSNLQEISYS